MTDPEHKTASQNLNDDAAAVRQLLANRDIECPRCGYNLRAIITGRCPECGLEITLKSFHKRRHKPLPVHLRVAMVLFALATGALLLALADSRIFPSIPCCVLPLLVPIGLWYGAWFVGSKASGEHEQWKLSVLGAILWGVVIVEIITIAWVVLSILL